MEAILFTASVDIKTVLEFLKKVDDADWVINTVQVPKLAPILRVEYDEWKSYWPMNFYERSDLIDELDETDQQYALERLKQLEEFMKNNSNMAIIVHPVKNEIMALGFDDRLHHPLKHAAMNAIQVVAEKEVELRNLKIKKKRSFDEPNYGYLCTGLDVFMYREPCVM